MANSKITPSEDRDQQVMRRLANIEHKVGSIEQTTAFALRADSERHFAEVKKVFNNSRRRIQVYLAANGSRSVQDIAQLHNMKMPNVSRELEKLRSEGLLEVIERENGKTYWGKTQIDRTIRISKLLMIEYGLTKDGFAET